MSVGTTSGIIEGPNAERVSVAHGRDADGKSTYQVTIDMDDGTQFECAIKKPEVLAYAAENFASAVAWSIQVREYLMRDLLKAINQDIDIEEAGDDEFIGYITDAQAAAERIR